MRLRSGRGGFKEGEAVVIVVHHRLLLHGLKLLLLAVQKEELIVRAIRRLVENLAIAILLVF